MTGTWRGTSRQRLYEELGWESLYHRRWYRRLTHFFCLRKSKSPEYLFNEIPQERQLTYSLRNPSAYELTAARTVRFSNTYFRNTLFEWNSLDSEIQNATTIAQFKKKLLSIIRPVKNSTYRISDISGIRLLTRLRPQFSALNEHRFRHAFHCLSLVCNCDLANEDNEHSSCTAHGITPFVWISLASSLTSPELILLASTIVPSVISFFMEAPVVAR